MPNPSDPYLMKLVETAIDDLAKRLSVPADQIELKEAAEVVWSDSSLGCPHPSSMYTQVLTHGFLIRLQSQGTTFEYHAGKTGAAIYCPNPMPPHEVLQSE